MLEQVQSFYYLATSLPACATSKLRRSRKKRGRVVAIRTLKLEED